jgi:hypothetical protein
MTLTAAAVLFGTACAYAADTTPGPVGKGDVATPYPSSSGRPSAVLSNSQCENIWQEALNKAPETNSNATQNGGSGSLGADQASPYIVNFAQADKDGNGKISKTEFDAACKNGWVQAAANNQKLNLPSETMEQSNRSGG